MMCRALKTLSKIEEKKSDLAVRNPSMSDMNPEGQISAAGGS